MRHFTTPKYWAYYNRLPDDIQQLADKSFALLKENPQHPSLRLKSVGDYASVRVGLHYRALGTAVGGDLIWFWIGTHAQYDKLLA